MFQRFLSYFIFFMTLWLILGFFFGPDKQEETQNSNLPITISTKDEWVHGQLVNFTIKNNTDQEIVLGETQNPPENITFQNTDPASQDFVNIDINREKLEEPLVLPAGEKVTLSYTDWNNELFDKTGDYKICVNHDNENYCEKFTLENPGILRSLWRVVFFKPIFNILIFFVKIFPGHSLALAILVLTLIIKLLLISPSKKSLVQQQKMQALQDEVNAVRQKYSGDQQKTAEATMAIWKKHKVNPFSSFMPMFIQLPVMIALFYVVKQGLMPHNEIYLWSPLQDFSLDLVSKDLLGILDLGSQNVLWLAIAVALFQFISMKLIMVMKKNGKNNKKDTKKEESSEQKQVQKAGQIMMYMMPLLIGFFSYSMPAAVGFYWAISTVFTIGQQYYLSKHA